MAKVNPEVSATTDIFSHLAKTATQLHLTSTHDRPGKMVIVGGLIGLREW